jgi:molecular chaperone HscB
MPADFLAQQMELRERLEEASTPAALDQMRRTLSQQRLRLENEIGETIDARKDYSAAAGLVRKLQFLDRLEAEIDAAYDTLE